MDGNEERSEGMFGSGLGGVGGPGPGGSSSSLLSSLPLGLPKGKGKGNPKMVGLPGLIGGATGWAFPWCGFGGLRSGGSLGWLFPCPCPCGCGWPAPPPPGAGPPGPFSAAAASSTSGRSEEPFISPIQPPHMARASLGERRVMMRATSD